eukprot:TRINITY_DN2834_c0_g1_i2.p1 TRINITY_DN2834_c0_g1~~TRINITY_DN2834_c0_g1_i2.p1  ORF type:complete len:218 (-),score=85.70 TRINITY_DN2834_c0_g1_i2:10-663(-)
MADFDISLIDDSDPRLFFANYTSSLLAVNSTLLAYALAAAAIAGAVGLALYFLSTQPASSGYNSYNYQSRGFRSGEGGTGFDVLTLLGVATDIYSKLNYDDTDCQKKIICEFMEEPDMFGSGGASVKSGVKYAASWLAPLGFSIVDQITEAATLDDEGKCEQRYRQCDQISLKTTYQEKSEAVKSVQDVLVKNTTEASSEEYEYEYYDDEEEEEVEE